MQWKLPTSQILLLIHGLLSYPLSYSITTLLHRIPLQKRHLWQLVQGMKYFWYAQFPRSSGFRGWRALHSWASAWGQSANAPLNRLASHAATSHWLVYRAVPPGSVHWQHWTGSPSDLVTVNLSPAWAEDQTQSLQACVLDKKENLHNASGA